ncbi:MAG TPA: iron ABC transporter permease [Acidimicrobiia bacterium]|nr:iron ABC transporter permease [Acidimicrobiia bacterium]
MTRPATAGRRLAFLVPLTFLGVFFVYPVVTILGRGLWPDGALDLDPLASLWTDGSLRSVAWFTIWQAALSTVLTLALGIPGAYVLSRLEFPGRTLIRALVTVPFVLPTVVVGSAFLGLGVEPSVGAILLAHVFFNYAVVVRTVGALWSNLDPHQEDAARVLGASRARAFVAVTLPALRPAILAATAITFLFTFTSFGVILVLGPPTRATIETEIYRQTAQLLDLRTAAALSVTQLLVIAALLLVIARLTGRKGIALALRAGGATTRRVRSAADRILLGVNLATMGLLLGVPIAVLVVRSFDTPSGFGLDFYRSLGTLRADSVAFVPPVDAIVNSLLFASAATFLALVVGGMASFAIARSGRGHLLDATLALPLGVSAVTVGFGFLIAFDAPPLDLRESWILVPIAHALIAIPFVVRVATPVLRSVDPRLREAAAVLGAPPRRVWREIDLPIAARALALGSGFAFAISLGEFGATTFLARPDRPTLPIVIFRLLGQPGAQSFGAAMAAATILAVLTAIAVLAVDRARVGAVGTF